MTVQHFMRWTLVVMLGTAACAPTLRVAPVTPEELDQLELDLARHADEADEVARIGIRFYEAGHYTRSTEVLAAALTLDPASVPALVYRGLAWEALARYDSALASYEAARALRLSGRERREIEGRLTLLARAQLVSEIRAAIARESTLAQVAPPPNTLAILPWVYVGNDPALEALERGIAHLLISDFGKVGRIHLLERERVQALVDELGLVGAGRVDPATAARSGRLLGAAHVLQGAIRQFGRPGEIELQARVVNTADAHVDAQGNTTDRLEQLFAMEKVIVFQVLDDLGIQPTPAERAALSERPTADLQAFLAFSRGLEAQDHGDVRTARDFYGSALQQDPAFRAARDRADVAAAAVRAVGTPALTGYRSRPGETGGPTRLGTLQTALEFAIPSSGGVIDRSGFAGPPLSKPRAPEALRQDTPGRINVISDIIIVIPRP